STLQSLSALHFIGCHWLRQCPLRFRDRATESSEGKFDRPSSHCHTSASSIADEKTRAKPVAPEEEVQGLLRLQDDSQDSRANLPASIYYRLVNPTGSLRSGSTHGQPPRSLP